jgi:ABC-type transport system substrate-binding protein
MGKTLKNYTPIVILSLFILSLLVIPSEAEEISKPLGEIRVVESHRPDINVLGHNVLQYLFEYALDKNELAPSLGVSREWIDETTLEIRLRQGVSFTNGEPLARYVIHPAHRFFLQYVVNLSKIMTSADEAP